MIFLTNVHTVTDVTTVKKILFQYLCKEQFDTFDNRCNVLRAGFAILAMFFETLP